jgi:pimeloyl-ACP methyl ester carboxylesterase
MTTLIFVHGACHGGWCWEHVTPFLEAAGLQVLAPDLPEIGPGERDPIARWGGFVAELAGRQEGRVVLAGHSRGGVVISAAAEIAPDAIDGLIYVAASLLQNGQTMTGAWRAFSSADADWVDPAPDGQSFKIRADAYHRLFCPMSDAGTAARAQARLGSEPMAAFKAPLRISDERYGSIPRAYVETSRDQIIPLAFQRVMQGALPCDPVITLDADHSPFLAMPVQLANVLVALAGGTGGGDQGHRRGSDQKPSAGLMTK